MTAGTANWSFTQDDFTAITESLRRFLGETKSLCALLVDRSGQLVTTVGEAPGLDTIAFATLTAADYSANDQLAKLVGETDFSSLFHQGEKESLYVADIARRLLLVIIFDSRTTVGLVRLRMKDEVEELTQLIDRVFSRGRNGDVIVFVGDSQAERMEANLESMQNLYDNMAEYGYDLTQMPFVIQYNKRDLPNAAPIEELQAALNPGWEVEDAAKHRVQPDPYHAGQNLVEQLSGGEWIEKAPYFEAIAVQGDGVFDTLKAVSKLVLKALA